MLESPQIQTALLRLPQMLRVIAGIARIAVNISKRTLISGLLSKSKPHFGHSQQRPPHLGQSQQPPARPAAFGAFPAGIPYDGTSQQPHWPRTALSHAISPELLIGIVLPLQELLEHKGPREIEPLEAPHAITFKNVPHTRRFYSLNTGPCAKNGSKLYRVLD